MRAMARRLKHGCRRALPAHPPKLPAWSSRHGWRKTWQSAYWMRGRSPSTTPPIPPPCASRLNTSAASLAVCPCPAGGRPAMHTGIKPSDTVVIVGRQAEDARCLNGLAPAWAMSDTESERRLERWAQATGRGGRPSSCRIIPPRRMRLRTGGAQRLGLKTP